MIPLGFPSKAMALFQEILYQDKKKKYSSEENRLHFKAYNQDFYRAMMLLKIVLLP